MKSSVTSVLLLQIAIATPSLAGAADTPSDRVKPANVSAATISGSVSVVDGRTLWFPRYAVMIRRAGIDSCDLAQWAFDPRGYESRTTLKPVPCGALAKAWLKRAIGGRRVVCNISAPMANEQARTGRCAAAGEDLALDMLRAGWARVTTIGSRPSYAVAQAKARAARYGIWATYVLDTGEWRRKALDKSLSRRPVADLNLLAERESEISPPFADAHMLATRTDR